MTPRPALLAAAALAATPAPARAEDDTADRRAIVTVQDRLYSKAGRWEIVAAAGVEPNDAFRLYLPAGLRLARHLSERFAIEASGAYLPSLDTSLRAFLQEQDSDLDARSRDRRIARAGAAAIWSPLYGKFAAGARIVHFDGYLLAGAGAALTEVDPDTPAVARKAVAPEATAGTGARVFLSQSLVLHLSLRQHAYLRPAPASGAAGGVGLPSEIGLALGTWFGGER